MASNAFTVHLEQLLGDADQLDKAHERLRTGRPGRQYGVAALNRAAVVMCVSAWEAYIEELVRESVLAMVTRSLTGLIRGRWSGTPIRANFPISSCGWDERPTERYATI